MNETQQAIEAARKALPNAVKALEEILHGHSAVDPRIKIEAATLLWEMADPSNNIARTEKLYPTTEAVPTTTP